MRVTVLHSKNYSPNEIHFLYPLYRFKNHLKNYHDIKLSFTSDFSKVTGDLALLTSKWFSRYWGEFGPDYVLGLLSKLSHSVNRIYWCDISDSTGTTHFMVLPFVDDYLKNQILKDKKMYLNKYYGLRITSDYIYKTFMIEDADRGPEHLNFIPKEVDLDKVRCGWNSGLAYFGRYRQLQSKLFPKSKMSRHFFKNSWVNPNLNKSIECSARIGKTYSRNTISKSREIIIDAIADIIPSKKISYSGYHNELAQSVSAISPFGLGEISLRDFEVVLNGTAMIKQDMSHLKTWPNLWIKDQTYLDFKWDMSDVREKVEYAIQNPEHMRYLAHQAQCIYKPILDYDTGKDLFCERFVNLIKES